VQLAGDSTVKNKHMQLDRQPSQNNTIAVFTVGDVPG
jgi:hypothetical protein